MAYKAIKSKEKYVHQYPKTVVRQRLAKGTKLFLILHRTLSNCAMEQVCNY